MTNDKSKNIRIGQDMLGEKEALTKALEFHKIGDLKSAESIYRKVYVQNPRCADVPHLSGLILYHFGELASAAYSVRRAITLDNARPHYHYNLGLILLNIGKRAEAGECFQKALSLDPNYQLARNAINEIKDYE